MELLKLQFELEESNYKYAVELQKDYDTLRRMRENMRKLKELLQSLEEKDKQAIEHTSDPISESDKEF
jgi:hypothetical protein